MKYSAILCWLPLIATACGASSTDAPLATNSPLSYQTAQSGKVVFVDSRLNVGGWQVNVGLVHAPVFRTEYIFETFSTDVADRDAQLAEIQVRVGETVGRGKIVGRLVAAGSGAHVHFGIRKNDVDVCPADYFIPPARIQVLAKLRETWPGAELCYP